MKRIGLISDTHSFLHPKVFEYFKECDEIWHAGDIGNINVLDELSKFKPIRAVYGNIDGKEIRSQFSLDHQFTVENVSVWMTHIGGYPNRYHKRIREDIKISSPNIFISGHSHILKIQYDKKLDLLHLNPGAAGKHGFHSIRTMLRFELDQGEIKNLEIIELEKRA